MHFQSWVQTLPKSNWWVLCCVKAFSSCELSCLFLSQQWQQQHRRQPQAVTACVCMQITVESFPDACLLHLPESGGSLHLLSATRYFSSAYSFDGRQVYIYLTNRAALFTDSSMVLWHRETNPKVFKNTQTMNLYRKRNHVSSFVHTPFSPCLSECYWATHWCFRRTQHYLKHLSLECQLRCVYWKSINGVEALKTGTLENVQTIMNATVILVLEKGKRLDGFSKSHSSMVGPYNVVLSTLQLI